MNLTELPTMARTLITLAGIAKWTRFHIGFNGPQNWCNQHYDYFFHKLIISDLYFEYINSIKL